MGTNEYPGTFSPFHDTQSISRYFEISSKGPHEITLLPFTFFTTIPADYIPFLVIFPGGFHQNILYFHVSEWRNKH